MRAALWLALALALFCSVDADFEGRFRDKKKWSRRTTTMLPTTREPPSEEQEHEQGQSQPPPPPQPAREDAEAERLELGMAERLDDKRFQAAEKKRVKALGIDVHDGPLEALLEEGINACLYVHCSAGRECDFDEFGEAMCSCVKECPHEAGKEETVCTNYDETFRSDCEVYQQRCLCIESSDLCRDYKYQHMQIKYYGNCRDVSECSKEQLLEVPGRMRDWLFSAMREMEEHHELTPHYRALKRAQYPPTQRWANSAIWRWCDINSDDSARAVSVHEVFPVHKSLSSVEHCIAPFLDHCDVDEDHRITLTEWGKCLQLDQNELDDRCNDFAEDPTVAY